MTGRIAERAKGLRSPKFGQIAEVRGLVQGAEGVVDLGYGEPNFMTPAHIREAGKRAIDEGYTHYVLPVEGLTPLREAIAKKVYRDNGMDVDPSTQVLVTAGVQEAINVVLLTLINPGDEVILPQPYYYADPLGVLLAGGVPVYTELREERDFRIDPADVKEKITDRTKAIFYISPNCPTGSVFRKDDLEAIAEITQQRDIFVITDEIYEKLVYDGEKHCSIASIPDMKDRTVSMLGFSKSYAMTGWRIGYLVANRDLIRMMLEIHSQLLIGANSMAQKAALAALTGPQDCIEEMRREYEARRNLFVEGLNRMGFRCKPPKGSFYIYANISELGMSGFEMAKRLARDARVLGYPGTAYTTDESGDKYIRFSYTKTIDQLSTALERIEKVIQDI
jgi:aspartate/methionine/tyrosine aminotransferase